MRKFYISTARPAVELEAIQQQMAALRIDGHFAAVERDGVVAVVDASGELFDELVEAERAQRVLQRGAPNTFAQAVIAFVELGTDDVAAVKVPAQQNSSIEPFTETKTVVCAEDDEIFSTMVEAVLARIGVDCVVVESGREALRVIEDLEPDLVLLDLMMPDMHGWEVVERMQTNDLIRDIPVVIVTAISSEQDQVFAHMVAGVKDYLVKPVSPARLRQCVWAALAR
jgi:CheY-like chemotaxis protein